MEWRIEKAVTSTTTLANDAANVAKAWPNLDAVQQFNQFFTLITQGARKLKILPVPRAQSFVQLHWEGYSNGTMTPPGDLENVRTGNITWQGLKLIVGENNANYTLLLVVDGVVSDYSSPIYVVSVQIDEWLCCVLMSRVVQGIRSSSCWAT